MNRRNFLGRLMQYYITKNNSDSNYGIYHPWMHHPMKANVYIRVKAALSKDKDGNIIWGNAPYTGTDGAVLAIYNENGEQVYCTHYYYRSREPSNLRSTGYNVLLPNGKYTAKLLSCGKGMLVYNGETSWDFEINVNREDDPNNNYGYISMPTVYVDARLDIECVSIEVKHEFAEKSIFTYEQVETEVTVPTYEELQLVHRYKETRETYNRQLCSYGQYTENVWIKSENTYTDKILLNYMKYTGIDNDEICGQKDISMLYHMSHISWKKVLRNIQPAEDEWVDYSWGSQHVHERLTTGNRTYKSSHVYETEDDIWLLSPLNSELLSSSHPAMAARTLPLYEFDSSTNYYFQTNQNLYADIRYITSNVVSNVMQPKSPYMLELSSDWDFVYSDKYPRTPTDLQELKGDSPTEYAKHIKGIVESWYGNQGTIVQEHYNKGFEKKQSSTRTFIIPEEVIFDTVDIDTLIIDTVKNVETDYVDIYEFNEKMRWEIRTEIKEEKSSVPIVKVLSKVDWTEFGGQDRTKYSWTTHGGRIYRQTRYDIDIESIPIKN